MDFYFSGVEGKSELAMLREAGVSRLLLDPTQIAKLHGELDGFRLALDSGAYRLFKQNRARNLAAYAEIVERWQQHYAFDFVTTLDDLENRKRSYDDWVDLEIMLDQDVLPVWHWSPEPMDDLLLYIDAGCIETGIGALVPYLFTDAKKESKVWCRRSVQGFCRAYPGRFRLFGACDLPLLNAVKDIALSADSSFWIRGRRRGAGFYVNRKTGRLCEAAPWLMKKLAPDYPEIAEMLEMDGRALSIANARELERFFNQE